VAERRADSTAVSEAGDETGPQSAGSNGAMGKPRLTAVPRSRAAEEPPPAVRLRREFKGLTVADLLRDEIVDRLPGQVRSACRHIENLDFAAAERQLPSAWAPVLPGPWRPRRERWVLATTAVFAVVLVAATLAAWFVA
jgi:hypothetical protein